MKLYKIFFVSVLMITEIVLTACNNINVHKELETNAYLRINSCNVIRSIIPENNLDNMTDFILTGKRAVYDDSQQLAVFENYYELIQAVIPIEQGAWYNLMLTAREERTVFSAAVENVIIKSSMNTISFELTPDMKLTYDKTGTVSVAFVTPDTVKSIKAGLFYIDTDYEIWNHAPETLTIEKLEDVVSATYKKDVNPGTYRLKAWFYADENQTAIVSTYKELITVVAGNTSEAKRTISELNDSYTITYDLNGGGYVNGYTPPVIYTRYNGFILLPTVDYMKKDGYFFDGWFTSEDRMGDRVTGILPTQEENLTLYAKWIRGCTVYATKLSDTDLANSSYGDTYMVRLLGTWMHNAPLWQNDEVRLLGSKIKKIPNNKNISLDMSQATGITQFYTDLMLNTSSGIFQNCTMLISALLPDSLENIGSHTFQGCSKLTSIEIPNRVTTIGWYAFDGCTSLKSVIIGNSVTDIGYWAFSNCTSLTSIEIPSSVTDIGQYAFSNCTSLDTIIFTGTMEQWHKISFSAYWHYNTPATKVTCIDGVIDL